MSNNVALRALSGYRRLFRARRQLFAGDNRALAESRLAIRAEFDKNRHITGPPAHIEGLLSMIDDAEDMLLHGIVRGELNTERNVVEVKIRPEHEARMDEKTMTHVDAITTETGAAMMEDGKGGKMKVEITKTDGADSR
jgi:complex III assembly factor LYRM7